LILDFEEFVLEVVMFLEVESFEKLAETLLPAPLIRWYCIQIDRE
jgi:hypothetical protein